MYDWAISVETLIEVVGEIRGSKRLVLEECHLARWVKSVLQRLNWTRRFFVRRPAQTYEPG